MKKIFIIAALVTVSTVAVNAQKSLNPSRSMTVEEARARNGVVEPTYQGGKTYSQFVSEQKTMKNQVSKPVLSEPEQTSITPANVPAKKFSVEKNQLKGNETAEPAPLIKQEPVVVNKAVVETPVVEMGNGNANPASVGLKPQKTVMPAEVKESRTPAEIEAARKAETLQVQKKPVTEENVTRTKSSPMQPVKND